MTRIVSLTALLVLLALPALAQTPSPAPALKTIGQPQQARKSVPSLIVLNSKGAALQGKTLTLSGVSPNAIVFADRPVRAAGHALTAHLLEEWAVGSDSFAKDPPNATISVLGKDGGNVKDAVVVLLSPKLQGDSLSFDVEVLEGDLIGAEGPASVFIDIIGMPMSPMSFAGAARRTAYRSAWYGGAAAAYPPFYAPGYHPYYPYAPPPAYYRPY
jgi:hypothetical protein